jgi:hypothetical protein
MGRSGPFGGATHHCGFVRPSFAASIIRFRFLGALGIGAKEDGRLGYGGTGWAVG